MELRLLEYAVEIARQRSFTRAAANLHIAQPSLSQQIAKLEEELCVRLFYRGPRGVSPTPEGVLFLQRAAQILQMSEDLKREMFEKTVGMKDTLTIGATSITVRHILPSMLEQYQLRFPDVHIQLIEEAPEVLHELTARGSVDISILALPVENSSIAIEPMFTEPIYVAFAAEPKHWMPERLIRVREQRFHRISLTELAESPFILLKTKYGFRHTVLELCAKSGFQPHISFETANIETAQAFAAHGLGVTLIPQLVKKSSSIDQKQPLYMELEEQPTRTVVFAYRKDRYLGLPARKLMEIYYQSDDRIISEPTLR